MADEDVLLAVVGRRLPGDTIAGCHYLDSRGYR
jgi:hypothetical protein